MVTFDGPSSIATKIDVEVTVAGVPKPTVTVPRSGDATTGSIEIDFDKTGYPAGKSVDVTLVAREAGGAQIGIGTQSITPMAGSGCDVLKISIGSGDGGQPDVGAGTDAGGGMVSVGSDTPGGTGGPGGLGAGGDVSGSGGKGANAGTAAIGGAIGTGAGFASGGAIGSGGAAATGGVISSGGQVGTGGVAGAGGQVGAGGVVGSGGQVGTGSVVGSGGMVGTGGVGKGGSGTGGAATGGSGTGGVGMGNGGSGAGGVPASCQGAATQCSSGGLQTCINSQWSSAIPCGPHETCAGTAGAAKCVCSPDPVCKTAGSVCIDAATVATCAQDVQTGCDYQSSASTCSTGLVCERYMSPACVDPSWAEWPMPNGPTDVAAGAPNLESYTDNGDQTVTDNVTGLMWQQAIAPGTYSYAAALAYCPTLTLGGHSDWRLPSIIELISLVDYGSSTAINGTYFPVAGGIIASNPPGNWIVGGGDVSYGPPVMGSVRCVR
jgi:hypothetical protein